jgi:hypothetical protein
MHSTLTEKLVWCSDICNLYSRDAHSNPGHCISWRSLPSEFQNCPQSQLRQPSTDCLHNLSRLSGNDAEFILWPRSVAQFVLVSSTNLESMKRYLLLSHSSVFFGVGCPLRRDDRSAEYKCCWVSPAQSFWGPSLVGLTTIFYFLRHYHPTSLKSQILVYISPRNKVVKFYSRALDPLSVPLQDS